ncbi:hypothetical protein RIF29_35336 [Crotalaria pallida]|uniref:Uncharacterized protein n=1 Tax=Crotalaria pallida TaxID=3830 RepID=A0AAN9EFI8_CROPI
MHQQIASKCIVLMQANAMHQQIPSPKISAFSCSSSSSTFLTPFYFSSSNSPLCKVKFFFFKSIIISREFFLIFSDS